MVAWFRPWPMGGLPLCVWGGHVANASSKCNWMDKGKKCPPTESLGTSMGGLVKNIMIENKCREQQAALIPNSIPKLTPNQFISVPTIGSEICYGIAARHPKSLFCCKLECVTRPLSWSSRLLDGCSCLSSHWYCKVAKVDSRDGVKFWGWCSRNMVLLRLPSVQCVYSVHKVCT